MRFVFLLMLIVAPLHAMEMVVVSTTTEPLIEIGAFGGFGVLPDYPGSDQSHFRWLALPFVVYRGRVLRTDDQSGLKARLLRREGIDLDLGFAGSFPVDSSKNTARRGMPDLDWLGEIGPRLVVSLYALPRHGSLRLLLPIRAVFSSDFQSVHHQGWTSAPTLSMELPDLWGKGWFGLMQLTTNFGGRRINAYFYEVAPEFSTADRPEYRARGGYMGTTLFAGLGTPRRLRARFFSGVAYSLYEGGANVGSPLFRSRNGVTIVAGVTWVIYRSLRLGFD